MLSVENCCCSVETYPHCLAVVFEESEASVMLTKGNARLSDEMTVVVNDRDQTVRVDLRQEPLWLLLQVNVDLLMWDVLGCHQQPHSLDDHRE